MWIAARDFRHPGWEGSFYPQEIPPEWLLTYYANEQRAVVLPEARWSAADAAQLEAWVADTPAGFRFFLEAGSAGAEALLAAARALGERLAGVVGDGLPAGLPTPPAVGRWPGPPDPRGLRTLIEQLAKAGPEALLIIEGDPPDPAALRTARTIAELLGA